MTPGRWLADRLGPGPATRAVDAGLAGLLVAAAVACLATGLGPLAVAAVVVASFVLEYVRERAVRRALAGALGAEGAEVGDGPLATVAAGVAAELGVGDVTVRATPVDGVVTALAGTDGPTVVCSRTLDEELTDPELRGVLAHEIAHLRLGHVSRPPYRDPVAHVVGFAALWVLVLSRVPPGVAALGGVAYLAAAGLRDAEPSRLLYVVGSAGAVLLPVALAALADRLEECRADDLATQVVPADDYCRGLLAVVAGSNGDGDAPEDGGDGPTPIGTRGSGIAVLTARHPAPEYRLARLGVARSDDVGEDLDSA